MAKDKRGGKRAGSNSGSEPIVFGGMTKSQIESNMMVYTKVNTAPPLTGTPQDVKQGTAERNSLGRQMINYATRRKSDGSPINAQLTSQCLSGTKSDLADFVITQAKSQTFGNSSLEGQKLTSWINVQNDMVQRRKRVDDIFSNRTNASFWIGKDDQYTLQQMQKYVDGKITKIDWR